MVGGPQKALQNPTTQQRNKESAIAILHSSQRTSTKLLFVSSIIATKSKARILISVFCLQFSSSNPCARRFFLSSSCSSPSRIPQTQPGDEAHCSRFSSGFLRISSLQNPFWSQKLVRIHLFRFQGNVSSSHFLFLFVSILGFRYWSMCRYTCS